MASSAELLLREIETLTPEQISQVEAFIDSLQERAETRAFAALGEPAFKATWDNPEDAAYDAL